MQPWAEEGKGTLLGIEPDPNSGYRAFVWFEYTRLLFNKIREGSLIAVRNFSDHPRNPDGSPAGSRDPQYQEYSVLQIDQVHPWHYAIQGDGEQGYPGFTIAAAESAREDWVDMDESNTDDVSRIRCDAIPLRLAFRVEQPQSELPRTSIDRSMPMPGFEAKLLSPAMTQAILNQGIDQEQAFELGKHIVEYEVPIRLRRLEFSRLHFGIFGYTGAGKSNLVSTLNDDILSCGAQSKNSREQAFKTVLVDLMDEYTGLLIDHLVKHNYSRLVVCGRNTLPEKVLQACNAAANGDSDAYEKAKDAATDWSERMILPPELKDYAPNYIQPLTELIMSGKVVFYETRSEQGETFDLDASNLVERMGPQAYSGTNEPDRANELQEELTTLIEEAEERSGNERDVKLNEIIELIDQERRKNITDRARQALNSFRVSAERQMKTLGPLPEHIRTSPNYLAKILNFQPQNERQSYFPSLTVIVGENEQAIARFAGQLIESCFLQRRRESYLYPTISFIFDEADVFVSQAGRNLDRWEAGNLVHEATWLARRGRKFGLGLGLATQRVRFLDTSIMAQPHTYLVSKLPQKSDRERIAEAFAVSNETLEQTFTFSVGQWLVTSHDATGLKGVPFPVQVPDANKRVQEWLGQYSADEEAEDDDLPF